MSNVFSSKKLINSMYQAPNLEHLLCQSKFIPLEENFHELHLLPISVKSLFLFIQKSE